MKCFTLASAIILSLVIALSGCGSADTDKYDYTVEDIVKPDLMFDTSRLFDTVPQTITVCETDGIAGKLLSGETYNGATSKAFFWEGTPTSAKPAGGYPAVLLLHGGGGNAFVDWVAYWNERGYVAIALDVGGQMYDENLHLAANNEFLCDGSWGSVGCGTDEESFKKSWTYMNISNAVLLNSYLHAKTDVNPNKIVATGISWGGFLTCILSGTDKRFAAFAPVYGCGNLSEDSWGLETAGLQNLSPSAREKWTEVYDPLSYLPYSTRPMLFTAGMNDHAFSPYSRQKSANLVKGKTFYSLRTSLEHGHYYKSTPCIEYFFDHVLNDAVPEVNFTDAIMRDNKITTELESVDKLSSMYLVYSLSTEPDTHDWRWHTMPIDFGSSATVSVDLPSGATAAFIEAFGESKGADFSTQVFFTSDMNDLK